PRLVEAMAGADAVVHLAWGFQPSHDLDYLERLAVGGTRLVAESAVAVGVPHLVHMSSVGAYSAKQSDDPVDESWPTHGIASSAYSRHKVAAERLLDRYESTIRITRFRPGIIGQRPAGSALLRYGLPGLIPAQLLSHVPLLPLSRKLVISVVHADDVAAAVARAVESEVGGAFNLSAGALDAAAIADALEARLVPVPSAALRPLVSAAWAARLQPVDPGWLDLAFSLPLLDPGRARAELGWAPTHTPAQVARAIVGGLQEAAAAPTSALRPRTVRRALVDAVRGGSVGRRRHT
ncbi:MAG: NAD-dependent epimerase/dehydratase family protein, partial [Nocardioides sp.]